MYKGRCLVLRGQKNEKNICYLEGEALRSISSGSKREKKVKFSNDVKVWKF